MAKMSKLKRGLKIYDEMGEHLWRVIGSKSKSTLLGLNRPDDAYALECEGKSLCMKRKAKKSPFKKGKPSCLRVRE